MPVSAIGPDPRRTLDDSWPTPATRRRDRPRPPRATAQRTVEIIGDGCVLTTARAVCPLADEQGLHRAGRPGADAA